MLQKVGIIGWRGMVGSVLLARMAEENDFEKIAAFFFSTSQAGEKAPNFKQKEKKLQDAYDFNVLKQMDIIISCQGSDYTKKVNPKLRQKKWQGYWIDAASEMRMQQNSMIVLDPINEQNILLNLKKGVKNYIGGNCTVSLMLMAIGGLFKENLVEWVSSMTYQAASGAGAKHMQELLQQMSVIGQQYQKYQQKSILDIEQIIKQKILQESFPQDNFGHSLALNLLPWIDKKLPNGQSKEEWKGRVETNKILNTKKTIPIDGTCVRVGALRSHSQALTIKLKKDIPLKEIETIIKNSNSWVKLIPNHKEQSLPKLTPLQISGTLNIGVGRIRKMNLGEKFLNVFTVGDQLLWGAAEPLRRMLNILNKLEKK